MRRRITTPSTTQHSAFTLIELLVVIAIITILLAILVPALKRARQSAYLVREMAAGQQLMVAFNLYAEDNKGRVITGLLDKKWVEYPPDNQTGDPHRFHVVDDKGRLLKPETASRYPWRLVSYVSDNFAGLILDKELLSIYAQKADLPDVDDKTSRQYAFSQNPSFGINATYIGGNGYKEVDPGSDPRRIEVQRIDQVLFPSRLLAFASARGQHVSDTSFKSEVFMRGWAPPYGVAPGWYFVKAPKSRAYTIQYDDPKFVWKPDTRDDWYGSLDLRHNKKAITLQFDGHAELNGLTYGSRAGLRDMRRWSNWATHDNWMWN